MALNPNIILAGQGVNVVDAFARGAQTGQGIRQAQRQNAMQDMLRSQGAGIVAGDQNALNALAGFDPQAAVGIQNTQLGMESTRQRMAMLSREEQRAIQAQAAQMSAAQRAEEAANITRLLSGAAAFYSRGDEAGYNAFLQQSGLDVQKYPFNQFEAIAAMQGEVLDVLNQFDERNAPEQGEDLPAAVRALQFRAEQAGLQPGTPEYMKFMADGGSKSGGFYMETRPDGTQVVSMNGEPESVGGVQPSSPEAMIASIDGILNDPALNISTGILSPLQNVPGTPQKRFGARARQLEGQAFLQAFESLKGGGQITEIEGLKATQAIGRLDTAQSADDYRDALIELREILTTAQSRPPGWVGQQGAPQGSNRFVFNPETGGFD